jgi:ankyrin repeat protein
MRNSPSIPTLSPFWAAILLLALSLARAWADDAFLQALVDHNAKVDAQWDQGDTALHWAAAQGHPGPARILLQAGATD